MSATNSDEQGNVSDHGNATTAIASWDEKAVSDMYFTLAEVRGVFTNAEAAEVEQRMRAKGYTFTAKQLQGKHQKMRAKGGSAGTRPAAEAKPKVTRKPRVKAAPKTDENGNTITKAKAAPKGRKAAAKKEPAADTNGDEVEAEAGPPNKKRKAAGTKAGKKVIQQTVEDKDAEDENAEDSGEGNASMMDVDHSSAAGSDNNGPSDDAATAQKTKEDAHATAEEEYDAENGGHFAEQMALVQASKADVDAEDDADPNAQLVSEHVRIESYVVQTSA